MVWTKSIVLLKEIAGANTLFDTSIIRTGLLTPKPINDRWLTQDSDILCKKNECKFILISIISRHTILINNIALGFHLL